MKLNKNKSFSSAIKIISLIGGILLIVGVIILYKYYHNIFEPNINTEPDNTYSLYIPTGSDYEKVKEILTSSGILIDLESFEWMVNKKNYTRHVYPGHYLIKDKMSNQELINLLRSGKQTPVNVIFNKTRTIDQLVGRIAEQLEVDSASLVELFYNDSFIQDFGFTKETISSMFIPNTYEFYWNTSAKGFFNRMHKEYNRFWNSDRLQKAEMIGLSPVEVITLASIVDEETIKEDEKPVIAGVFLNRLNRGMRLQADPTIRFALGNFEVNRILKKHLQINSPYNTYIHGGLPPGPISIPNIASIDAVLNYEKHQYLYFCAKDDFSGYHSFAKTLSRHNENARRYQRALNQRRIWR